MVIPLCDQPMVWSVRAGRMNVLWDQPMVWSVRAHE